MVPGLQVLLFLTLHLLQNTESSMVHLNSNGYEGVVIAINPSVPEDERLIPSIKVRRGFIVRSIILLPAHPNSHTQLHTHTHSYTLTHTVLPSQGAL
jgi:hypothetical protein